MIIKKIIYLLSFFIICILALNNTTYGKKSFFNDTFNFDKSKSEIDTKAPIGFLRYGINPISQPVKSSVGIDVLLYCTDEKGGSGCSEGYVSGRYTKNGVYSLTISDKAGNKTIKSFEIKNIDDKKPTGNLFFSTSEWTNGKVSVSLSCSDSDENGYLRWCNPSTGAFGEYDRNGNYSLSIKDAAGNITIKNFTIDNIDTSKPIYKLNYSTIEVGDTTQKMTIECIDEIGGSGCIIDKEIIEKPLGTSGNLSVSDKAGNKSTFSYSTARSASDYSDRDLAWTNGNRTLWLECSDNLSGCLKPITEVTATGNIVSIPITIGDYAKNEVTRNYEILKIDKLKPEFKVINYNSTTSWKASDINKIIMQSFDTGGSGLEYSKYIWNSDTCNTNGTSFNLKTSINQTNAGNHKLHICAKDVAGNVFNDILEYTIFPADIDISKSSLNVKAGEKFGNYSDEFEYTLELKDNYGNPVFSSGSYDREISNLKQNVLNYGGGKDIKLNEAENKGNSALEFNSSNYSTDIDGKIYFNVKSFTPGTFTQRFSFNIPNWNDNYGISSGNKEYTILINGGSYENEFKKPIVINSIKISDDLGANYNDIPTIGKDQKYKINLINTGSLNNYSNGKLDNLDTGIGFESSGHGLIDLKNIDKDFGSDVLDYLGFNSRIEAKNSTGVLKQPILKTKDLQISYNIGGKNVKYLLDDGGEIKGCDKTTLGLKVEGSIQGDGKSDITGQEGNFSDLTKSSLRGEIRKNAYKLIQGMNHDQLLNGVKYIEGDITISGNLNYETLIVKNGNVTISGDLNDSNKKLGIIILKDNYNISSDYKETGNIYVNKNVENINAIIYSDGTFRSADINGDPYSDVELSKNSLILNGSLFTRNTVGGAVAAGGDYILPGGQKSSDFNLAQIYDLNYIRKSMSCSDNYSFLIKYNPMIQVNPPKGFSK